MSVYGGILAILIFNTTLVIIKLAIIISLGRANRLDKILKELDEGEVDD